MKFLSKEKLEALNTKRLLAYKNALLKVPETKNWDESDYSRLCKEDPEWQEHYLQVKTILGTRENVA